MKHSDTTISVICHTAFIECQRTLSAVLDSREGAKLILTANGNAEAAEYFEKIAMQREGVEVVVNTQNLGFIGPSNLAFDKCETDFFVALNDDALPPPDWLDKMKAPFADPRVVITGPGGRWLDHHFVGHRWWGGLPMEPDFIEGSCFAVRVVTLRDHNEPLFWKELKWAYCDDAELCLRMRKLGYKIVVTDFNLIHKSGTTTRTVPHLHDEIRKNFVLCEAKWKDYLRTRKFE